MAGDALMDVGEGRRFRKRGHGWDAVASAIVIDMAHLLPPPAPDWTSWLLSETHYYRADGSLVIDTYEGRWRDEHTGEGGTVFTLLVRLLGSWGAARRWLHENGHVHGLGPGPRREPGGRRTERQKRRSGNGAGQGDNRFWNPGRVQRTEQAPCPAPAADQFELWPEESLERVRRRNREAAARQEAEREHRWQAEMAKLSPAERNLKEAQRWKRKYRHGLLR